METDKAEQLDALLSQSRNVLSKKWDLEETDASTTSKQKICSPCLLITKTLITPERKNTDSTFSNNQYPVTGDNKSIIVL